VRGKTPLVELYHASDPATAHLLCGMLRAEGIDAVVRGEHLHAARGGLPVLYPSVWIFDDDALEAARAILQRFVQQQRAAPPPQGSRWDCAGCGEVHEPQFTECWRCGKPRGPYR